MALAEVEAKWANLRQGPRFLSEREAYEVAIEVHDHWIAAYQDNPSAQVFWRTELMPRLWAASPPLDYDRPESSIVGALGARSNSSLNAASGSMRRAS